MATFPLNPVLNQTVNFGSTTWRFDGQGWVRGSFIGGYGGLAMERVDYVMLLVDDMVLTPAMVAPYLITYV